MKKSLIGFLMLTAVLLTGCQRTTEELLSYEDTLSKQTSTMDQRITQSDFIAKDIAVVTDQENVGGDETITAGAALFINQTDKEIIYADHVFDQLYPASLTKLMTALVVLRYGELNDLVTIGQNATDISKIGAKVCGYKEGDTVTLEALLYSLIVYSGNDAAIAIAEHVGSNEENFVNLMNKEALKIGAVHSNFVNSHGLQKEDQLVTAYDIYLIMKELLTYDTFKTILGTNSYTAIYHDKEGVEKQKTFSSTNPYKEDNETTAGELTILGGLAGSTNKAGHCLILYSKDQDNKEYISILLKTNDSDSLYTQMNSLLLSTSTK